MAGGKIKAGDVLGEALQSVKREWEIFLLLSLTVSLASVFLFWPYLRLYALMMTADLNPESFNAEVNALTAADFAWLFIAWLASVFATYGGIALWSRVSVLGRGFALTGGVSAWIRRTLWACWRYICLLGWAIVGGIVLMIPLILLIALAGVNVTPSEAGTLSAGFWAFIIPFYLVLGFAMCVGLILFNVSIHAEARDVHLPIHGAFGAMRGNIFRAAGLMLLLLLAFYAMFFVAFLAGVLALIGATGIYFLAGMVLVLMAATALNFVLAAYGAHFAVRVVPELKG